jgi:signal transduction histidine kinase
MVPPVIPSDDKQRLKELHSYGVLDTMYEEEFNDVVRLAARLCQMPIAMISLVDKKRLWFKAKIGINDVELPREISFCAHVVASDLNFFEVQDALQDQRFEDNPWVKEDPNIRYYAAVPLINKNGYKMGTLCVYDHQPNSLDEDQQYTLKILAKQVVKLLEHRLVNRKMEQQQEKLQVQMDLQNRILSIIAHDVRNPIHAVKSIIELSNRKVLAQQQANELMAMAGKQIDGTLELLNNLIDWGSMQMRGKGFETEKVHLRTLVSNMYKTFEVIASLKSNIMVNLVDEDLFIVSDINALRFILRNLISNANKFTKEGVITVFAQRDQQNQIAISITDTGVGMSEETRLQLFDAEKYQSASGTGNEKGSGLGLVLTKDFVSAFGGTIRVESKLGKGTSVYLTFPN